MSLSEDKPLLYHYTTGSGLLGIVDSQQIHATSIAYLNDEEEHIGYFRRRLPALLNEAIADVLHSWSPVDTAGVALSETETKQKAAEFAETMRSRMLELSLEIDDPYVASFSAPPRLDHEDGLLSQWRAYGSDGGYAVVFQTAGVESLLELEFAAFHHQYLMIGDVEYYGSQGSHEPKLQETLEDEKQVKAALKQFMITGILADLDPLYTSLVGLSVRHKHRGFREEAEIRIVALRSISKVRKLEETDGELRPQREILFRSKAGILVPYIRLFGKKELGDVARLPIKQIIVGPHPEKAKRRAAVERLLRENGIVAAVTESSIPYLGT